MQWGHDYKYIIQKINHNVFDTVPLQLYQKKHFRGLGLCVTNLTDNIEQYMRGLFLLM